MPAITFFGPDKLSQIVAVATTGQEVARFTVHGTSKSSFSISRVFSGPNASPLPICNGEKSSLSSSVSMVVHGQNIKLKYAMDTLAHEAWKIETSTMGTLRWKYSSGGQWKLEDGNDAIVAKGAIKESKLEVFVLADETILDVWLSAWVALLKGKGSASSGAEGVHGAVELIGALAGGGGGGGA